MKEVHTEARPFRVAVLDDDFDSASATAKTLAACGVEAQPFGDEASLQLALQFNVFDAFVLDWVLADGTAEAVVGHLRGLRQYSECPIVILSGNLTVNAQPLDQDLAKQICLNRLTFRAKPTSIVRLAKDLLTLKAVI